ncbi:MAG: ATP-binding protein [Elusimicrobiota bacterium]
MRIHLVRRLRDLPIRAKLSCLLGILILNLAAVISIGAFGMSVLSSLRAYVGGEGLWAKAQKNAIVSLNRYALTRDEADYRAFQAYLRIPLGDRKARLAMERPVPDAAAAEAGFIEGGNHPDDVHGLVLLFLRYRRVSYIARAIEFWTRADDSFVELQARADELHRAVASGRAPPAEIHRQLRRIGEINERLSEIEDQFSYALGEGSRWAKRVLLEAMLAGSLLLAALSLWISLLISGAITAGVRELAHAAGRAARGDLDARVVVDSADELGFLGDSFNRMVDGLSKLDRMKIEFLSTVSHELRTPLTLAMAPLESLLSGQFGAMDAEQRRLLAVAHDNAVRLLQMVNGLLDFSRLEAGMQTARREALDPAALTTALIRDFRPIAANKGLTLEFREGGPAGWVSLDRYLYERILFNLLSNAVKFTPKGGRVSVELSADGDRLRLTVRDTGIGIAKEDQGRLFQKFRQIESSSTRRFEGTGLGLALVKEFSALLGGTASVDSEAGRGSAFTVECLAPRVEAPAAPPPPEPTPQPLPKYGAPEGGKDGGARAPETGGEGLPRVLIAEDNADMRDYLERLLRDFCRTRAAGDGASALAMAREWNPDLVVADVMMPGKDGLALCREFKADPAFAATPVVLLTALTDREAMRRGWEAGADEYLFKPFHPTEVLTRIRTLLSSVAARRAAARALEDKARELERSNADLETFAYSAAHDLQEPLRKIIGFSQLLEQRREAGLDAETRDVLGRIVGATKRMQELIDDLLRYSRVARKREEPRRFSAQAALERALSNLEAAVKESGTAVVYDGLPTVSGDEAQVVQLFQNLIGNAVKFRSGRAPEVRVDAERRGAEWLFAVRDNGIGFEPRYRERIFDVFERLHSRAQYPGTGIGLAICKKIVERGGGRIWAESEPGKGSAFFFTLPE